MALIQPLAGCGSPADTKNNDTAGARASATSSESPAMDEADLANGQLVVAFGDSLFAGYQLDRGEGFAPVLQAHLREAGVAANVFNAGVSGDTSAGGRQRLGFVLDGLPKKPDLVIVELGANDMLRGLPAEQTRENLVAILDELKKRDIPAMLAGMVAAPNMGADYANTFNAIYPDLAREYDIPLYPFVLDGVAAQPKLQLDDGMHPNAQGVTVMVDGIAPMVTTALRPG